MNSNLRIFLAALVLTGVLTARAVIPEPDNLIYGSITLSNVPITAARTDVVIEARRTTNGPAIASYRMGSNPALGDFYSLTLAMESVTPVADTNASQVGDSVFVSVLEGGSLRGQTGFLITERGIAQRMDFGSAVTDGDGDGLPDAWELFHFAGLGQSTNSISANGQTAWQNYLAGTDPNDANDGFRLSMAQSNSLKQVSFLARRAEGPGYEGLIRHYTLESKTNLANLSWTGVTGYIGVTGNNQTVIHQTTANSGSAFFRGSISLTSSGNGSGTNDLDADGLPDAWEVQRFGNLSANASSMNLNGQTALQNYVAGTDPNNSGSVLKLTSSLVGSNRVVSFMTIQAQGIGYEGRQRFYALESSPTTIGPWQPVSGLTSIPGSNQLVTHQSVNQPTPIFYRGRVWLVP